MSGLASIVKRGRRRLEQLDTRTAAYVTASASGYAGASRARVYTALVRAGMRGATCSEIAAKIRLGDNQVIARLTELERAGAAWRGEAKRRSDVTGYPNEIWFARPPSARQLTLYGSVRP